MTAHGLQLCSVARNRRTGELLVQLLGRTVATTDSQQAALEAAQALELAVQAGLRTALDVYGVQAAGWSSPPWLAVRREHQRRHHRRTARTAAPARAPAAGTARRARGRCCPSCVVAPAGPRAGLVVPVRPPPPPQLHPALLEAVAALTVATSVLGACWWAWSVL